MAGARNWSYGEYKRLAEARIAEAEMTDEELRANVVAHIEALEFMRTDDHEGQVRKVNLVALVVAEHLGLSFNELLARGEEIEGRLCEEAKGPDVEIPF